MPRTTKDIVKPGLAYSTTTTGGMRCVVKSGFSQSIFQEVPGANISFSAEYQAILSYATGQGYTLPSVGQQVKQNTFLQALKDNGLWVLMDTLYVFATDGDSNIATLNWKNSATFQASKISNPTFTASQGFTGDGIASHLNTNWTASVNGVNYTLNSACMGTYVRTAPGAVSVISGAMVGSNFTQINIQSAFMIINSAVNTQFAIAQPTGLFTINRSASNATQAYQNGTNISSQSNVSTSLESTAVRVLARTNGAGFDFPSSAQVSMHFTSGSLTPTRQATLSTLWTNYLTSLP